MRLYFLIVRPVVNRPAVAGAFPATAKFSSRTDDVVLDDFLAPMWRRFRSRLGSSRVLQQGSVQSYLVYILIALFVLLLLTMPWSDIVRAVLGGQ
jgi:hypothetical protein